MDLNGAGTLRTQVMTMPPRNLITASEDRR